MPFISGDKTMAFQLFPFCWVKQRRFLVFLWTYSVFSTEPSASFAPHPSRWHPQQKQAIYLSLSKDQAAVLAANSTSGTERTTLVPLRQQVLKLQDRLEEIHDKNAQGENLTQEYCDAVLGLCVAAEEWENVLDVLDIMKMQGLAQERSSYRTCLQSCFEMGNGASALEILHAMEYALVSREPTDVALVVAAMCRNNKKESGWWRKALKVINDNLSPEVPIDAYDAILACMVDERRWKEAIRLIREIERGSTSNNNQRNGETTHPKPALSTYREAIECCVAANQAEQSVHLLMSMTDQGVKPTVYTFELVIAALAKKLQWRRALQMLDLMDELNVSITQLTFNTVIGACAKAGEVGVAKQLIARMRKQNVKPDIVTFNSVISACASTSRWRDALNVLDLCMREPGVSPDIYTYTNAIRACAKGGKTQRALALHDVVKHKKLPLDSYFYAAVIEACAKERLWKKALELLREMEENGISPTDVIYSVTITACGNGGQWKKALDLLDAMRDKGMRINVITYNSAITALSKAAKQSARPYRTNQSGNRGPKIEEELWTKVMQLLNQMEKDGLKPDGFSYSSAISCCGAEGRWKEALELIDIMQKGGPRTRPNKIAYTAAISACGRSGEYKHALSLFRDMKDQGLSPDRVAYNAMFNALKIAKKPNIAFEMWEEMCGTKSNTTALATAKADRWTTPDIITVTDVIAALSIDDTEAYKTKVDVVFSEAVKRGIVLRAGTLDSIWEVDLSGMAFPVARAAVRHIVKRALDDAAQAGGNQVNDLTLITGVGRTAQQLSNLRNRSVDKSLEDDRPFLSLRDYVQQTLQEDFRPPLDSFIPKREQGSVQVDKSQLLKWARLQNGTQLDKPRKLLF